MMKKYQLNSHASLKKLEQYRPLNNHYFALKAKAELEGQMNALTGAQWPQAPPPVDLKIFRE